MLTVDLTEGTPLYGDAFEHFIVLEVMKGIAYLAAEINVSFFRTSDGAEVDLVLEKHGQVIPVEIKSATAPRMPSGLRAFLRDHTVHAAVCVCRTPRAYTVGGVDFLPWQTFVERLFTGKLFEV